MLPLPYWANERLFTSKKAKSNISHFFLPSINFLCTLKCERQVLMKKKLTDGIWTQNPGAEQANQTTA